MSKVIYTSHAPISLPHAFKTTLEELKKNPGPFVIEKSKFIARIEKALSLK